MSRISAALALTASNEAKIVQAFRVARAVSLRAAKSLGELGLNNSQALQQMVTAAVVRRAGPDRYFLDESAWAEGRNMSGKNIWRLGLGLAFAVAAVAWYFAG